MISFQFTGIEGVIGNLLKYEQEQRARLRLACEEIAKMLESYAIMHHPWTVRTQGTNLTTLGTWDELPDAIYQVVLSAGMNYDRFLELAGPVRGDYAAHEAALPNTALSSANAGKWAWLYPTMIACHQEALNTFARHLWH
jgi:hypothetical protein